MMGLIRDEIVKQGKFVFDISYLSEQGGRPVNEDSVVVAHKDDKILLSVADGLGAHGGGDVASAAAAAVIETEYMKLIKAKPANIHNIFQMADDAIVAAQTETVKMKTTLACVWCRCKWLYAAHLGDTRIYTFKNDKQTYLTVDHSVAYEEVMKNHGTLDDIRKNPRRHILKAALGVGKIRPPDMFRQRLRDHISVLICSDGFWEYVHEGEMTDTLRSTATAHEWLEAMLQCHKEKADRFHDNYSAICLRIISTSGGNTSMTGLRP